MKALEFFETQILKWFETNGREFLPWRKKQRSAYEVWVSEIMLQQTQVSRVIDYYNRFIDKFPTVFDLAKSNWEEFYPYYAGLGYYNRGRNMLACAQQVVETYKGKFPENKEQLKALPGIGSYTASAILSFAYNKNEISFDTNIKKVLGRVFLGSRFAKIDEDFFAKNLKSQKKKLNAAIMDFSNSICLKVPRCGECPLQKYCEYYKTDGQKEAILKKGEGSFPSREAGVYLWIHKDHKEYYSTQKKKFKPFVLNKKYNTRETIKKYFQHKYALTLSVRPPHKKLYIEGKPVLFINAQILLGKHHFTIFQKDKI